MKKKVILIISPVLIFTLIIIVILFSTFLKYKEEFSSSNFISDIDITKIKDGEYEGEYRTTLVSSKVLVYVKNGKIKSIDIIEHKHGRGKKGEEVINRVISAQSLRVDAVSGATISSKVILKALENALLKGGSYVRDY